MKRKNLQELMLSLYRFKLLRPVGYSLLKLLTVEIPRTVKGVGGIQLPHGAAGLVVHPSTRVLGTVKLFQGVTIGRADNYLNQSYPTTMDDQGGVVIEDGVQVSAGAKILFRSGQTLRLGKNSVVGANAVVLRSIPDDEVWAGAPAKKVGIRTF